MSHVLSMREKLEKMAGLVQENLAKAQEQQKHWYDQNARQRELKAGDQVLVLLPTSTHKLLAQWQGPYQVLKRVGEVNYLVDMHDHRKRRRVFHINMLREWSVPVATGYWMEEVEESDEDDVLVWKEGAYESVEQAGAVVGCAANGAEGFVGGVLGGYPGSARTDNSG